MISISRTNLLISVALNQRHDDEDPQTVLKVCN